MNTQAIAILINDLLTTESQSLLHHVVNGRPYVDADTFQAWNALKDIAHRDTNHAARLSALLLKLDLPEMVGVFAQNVAFLHFMTVQKLVPMLIDEKRQQIDRYEQAIVHAAKNANAVAELTALRDEDRDEIEELEAIAIGFDSQRAAETALPLAATADLQNIANVAAATAKLAAAKGETPAAGDS